MTPRITTVHTCGSTTHVYECRKGEGIPWHKHSNSHGHLVIRGKTTVEFDNAVFERTPDVTNLDIKGNDWHKITAMADDTIFINISVTDHSATTEVKDAY